MYLIYDRITNLLMIAAICCVLMAVCAATAVSAASLTDNTTLRVTPVTASVLPDEPVQYQLIADNLPDGLAGYLLTVNLSHPGIAEITGVSYPAWAVLTNTSALPDEWVRMSAVDLNRAIEPGATNVTLGNVTIRGVNPGITEIIVNVLEMDADGGDMIIPAIVNGELTVQAPTPPIPEANFTATPTSGNAPLTVQFTDTSTGDPDSWAWDFSNDGIIDSTSQNPGYTYPAPGTYSVNLTVSNDAGTDSELKTNYITVTETPPDPPVANFTGTPRSGNTQLTVQFTDTSTGDPDSWAWDFSNDGIIDSTSQNPGYTYPAPGTYSVNLTISNDAGTDSELKTNYITVTETPPDPPVANFLALPRSGTAPLHVQFNDTSTNGPTAWAWDFNNDGTIESTAQNPQYTYTAPGTYSVNLTVSNEAGSNSRLKTAFIIVQELPPVPPVASFSGSPRSGNAPLSVQFTDASTGDPDSWAWDFNNDGIIESTAQNPHYTYLIPGTYTVVLTVTNAGGNDTRTEPSYITVTSPVNPTVAVVPGMAVVHPGGTTQVMLVADTLPAGLSGYRLWVNLSHPGIAEITGVSYPDWANLNRTSVLPAESVEMSAVDLTRMVEPGATNVSLGTITIRGEAAGTTQIFLAIGQMDDDTGSPIIPSVLNGTCAVTVVPPVLVADFTADRTSGIAPLCVHFTDTSSGGPTAWAWDFTNDGTIDSTIQNPTFTYAVPGTYSVNLTVMNATGQNSTLKLQYITVVSPGQKAMITGYVSSGSDYGPVNVPRIRIRIAQSAADLNNPSKRWEATADARGVYSISDVPAGVPLYAVALSPSSQPNAYYERPVQYQVNGGSLITCQNSSSTPWIPSITAGSRAQVNWVLSRNPNSQFFWY